MTVAIVTDSTAALPEEVQAAWDIAVVPLMITVNGRTVADGDLDTAEILDAQSPHLEAFPGAFINAIASQDQDDGVVVLTVSSTLSSTHRSAIFGRQGCRMPGSRGGQPHRGRRPKDW